IIKQIYMEKLRKILFIAVSIFLGSILGLYFSPQDGFASNPCEKMFCDGTECASTSLPYKCIEREGGGCSNQNC
ncbi:MAG: hypothetical protein WD597_00395, partial [Balneolaceae bacterium]